MLPLLADRKPDFLVSNKSVVPSPLFRSKKSNIFHLLQPWRYLVAYSSIGAEPKDGRDVASFRAGSSRQQP